MCYIIGDWRTALKIFWHEVLPEITFYPVIAKILINRALGSIKPKPLSPKQSVEYREINLDWYPLK